jgi:fructose-bisphosphate aldolase class 1
MGEDLLLERVTTAAEKRRPKRGPKPMSGLPAPLNKANTKRIFGTKMRSVIKKASAGGIQAIVDQQFEVATQILAAGLVPIVEESLYRR